MTPSYVRGVKPKVVGISKINVSFAWIFGTVVARELPPPPSYSPWYKAAVILLCLAFSLRMHGFVINCACF